MAGESVPYLGSKISIVSKSEIRYEGVLYTVDTKAATIALAKVRCLGTEDRPTERPVSPRDEVYEYIIFKAIDIKDLVVCETPKPVPQLCGNLPYDPAIVQASQLCSKEESSETPAHNRHEGSRHASAYTPGRSATRSSPPMRSEARFNQLTVETGVQTMPDSYQSRDRPPTNGRPGFLGRGDRSLLPFPLTLFPQAQQGGRRVPFRTDSSTGSGGAFGRLAAPQGPPGRPIFPRFVPPINQLRGRGRGFGSANRGGHVPFAPPTRPAGGAFVRNPYNYPMPPYSGYFGLPRGRGRAGYPVRGVGRSGTATETRTGDAAGTREILNFDTDFDFDVANAEFEEKMKITEAELAQAKLNENEGDKVEDKDKIIEQDSLEEGDIQDPTRPYYDRTKSFFDRISCESLEKIDGQYRGITWDRERELNKETFGVPWARFIPRGNRGRGGLSPMGQRGGFARRGHFRTAFRGQNATMLRVR